MVGIFQAKTFDMRVYLIGMMNYFLMENAKQFIRIAVNKLNGWSKNMAYLSFKPWVALQLLVAVKGFPSSFVQLKDSPVLGATILHVFQASLPLMGRRQLTTNLVEIVSF